MSAIIEDAVICEAFRGDKALTVAAVWVLRFVDNDTARAAVHGLMYGTLNGEQAAEATAYLYSIAHELDVMTSAVRRLTA